MGQWNTGYFGNDDATELLLRLKATASTESAWALELQQCFDRLDAFLARERDGLAYRPMTDAEVEICNQALREAMKDLPELLEQSLRKPGDDCTPIDVGDSEALTAGAAAALVALGAGADFVKLPKNQKLPEDFVPDAALVRQARLATEVMVAHKRLPEFVGRAWLKKLAPLSAFLTAKESAN